MTAYSASGQKVKLNNPPMGTEPSAIVTTAASIFAFALVTLNNPPRGTEPDNLVASLKNKTVDELN